ncbi:hypothetical protein F5Y08DRAFT_345304 [Xylaria arbuscula]|nr:hypothetical protein F5Y08DRAFT_345304 [Xylaria arbuscula]
MSVVHCTSAPSPDTKDFRANNPSYKCKYLEPYNGFESQADGLGTWVLLFMTKGEIFDTAPAMKTLAADDSHNLLKFTQYLNPTYISFRAEHLLKSIDNGFDLKIPETRNVESMIREWNNAHGRGQKESITRAFAAVACFKLFNAFRKAVTISQGLKNPQDIETYFENSFYAMLAEFDRGSPHPNTSALEKWSKVKNLGASLYALAKNFGGDGFFTVSLLKPFVDQVRAATHVYAPAT